MADYLVQEDGTSKILLEGGSGALLLETGGTVFTLTASDTGLAVTDSLVSTRSHAVTDTGLTLTDSVSGGGGPAVALTDTGLTVTDSLASVAGPAITDRGLTFGTVLWVRKNTNRVSVTLNEDTGLTVADSITVRPTRKPTDTGVTVTTATPQRLVSRAQPTTTGLTVADSITDIERRFVTITDTGLTFSDSIFGGHGLTVQGMGGFASQPILDNFNRANENPLSDSGQWTKVPVFGGGGNLQLISNQVTGTVVLGNNAMSFSGAGTFGDLDVWATLGHVPAGTYAGVIARQNVTSVIGTGQNCYQLLSVPSSNEILLQFVNLGGGVTFVGSWPITTGDGDAIGLRCVGNVLTAYYRPAGGAWQLLGSVTDNNAPWAGYAGLITNNTTTRLDDFGASLPGGTDRIIKTARKFPTDTGLSFSDGGIAFPIFDVGLNFSTTLIKSAFRPRSITDTGLTIADSAGNITITDTGLSFSTSLVAQRVVPRGLTDTGLTFSDSLRHVARKVVSDTGLSFTDAMVVRKNGGSTSVSLTDIGVTVTTSISKSGHYFRPIGIYAGDTGLSISDGIRRTVTPPQPPPARPSANFTSSVAGETVTFTDTSTPGSAPIGSWAWSFGDGNTSSATNPVHTYGAPDTYNVTLTVVTVYGHSSVTKPVTTSDAPVGFGTHIDAVIF